MAALERITSEDRRRNTRFYNLSFNLADMLYDHHGWHVGNKEENFATMIRMIREAGLDLFGTRNIDVGCGFGDFSAFLAMAGGNDYLGVDIHRPSLEGARQRYPARKFVNADILTRKYPSRFDFAFASGSLSTNLESDNYDFMESMIRKMWEITNKGVVFNFLPGDGADGRVYCYDVGEVLQIVSRIAPEAKIVHRFGNNQCYVLTYRT